MAELAKKLHFLKSGTEQTAKAYSTASETGDNYVRGKVDGVACYIPIGATDDAMATNGRVIKGGTTYAIKSQAKPPYAEVSYTNAGTYTFTVPNNVTRLRVAVCGGGGGGCVVAFASASSYTAGAGGNSSVGSISATGGVGGKVGCGRWDEDASYPYDMYATTGASGTPNGRTDGKGFALSFAIAGGTYGQCGTASGQHSSYGRQANGGSGGYNSGYINVTSGQTITVTVGGGGAYKKYRGSGMATNGASGFALIAYGGDI